MLSHTHTLSLSLSLSLSLAHSLAHSLSHSHSPVIMVGAVHFYLVPNGEIGPFECAPEQLAAKHQPNLCNKASVHSERDNAEVCGSKACCWRICAHDCTTTHADVDIACHGGWQTLCGQCLSVASSSGLKKMPTLTILTLSLPFFLPALVLVLA